MNRIGNSFLIALIFGAKIGYFLLLSNFFGQIIGNNDLVQSVVLKIGEKMMRNIDEKWVKT
jgi:hypothetical protein